MLGGAVTKDLNGTSIEEPEVLLERVVGFVVEARGFHFHAFEQMKNFVPEEAVAELRDLLERACLFLDAFCRMTPETSGVLGETLKPREIEDLSDVCFILDSELRACRQHLVRLAQAEEQDRYSVLIAMERTRNKVISGLCALEVRLSQLSGLDSKTRHIDLTRRSLVARRIILKFLARLPSAQEASDNLQGTIRWMGTTFAWLVGHESFHSLRAEDRLMTKQFQQMLLEWLRGDASERRGRQIWHELQVFIEMLRPSLGEASLLDHDLQIIENAVQQLSQGEVHGLVDCTTTEILGGIIGLDEQLDLALRQGADKSLALARLIELRQLLLARQPARNNASKASGASPCPADSARVGHLRLVKD